MSARTKTVRGWGVMMDDGELPDLTHPNIGAFYHVCSNKGSAVNFVNRCNKELKEKLWFVVPCDITYSLPIKK